MKVKLFYINSITIIVGYGNPRVAQATQKKTK